MIDEPEILIGGHTIASNQPCYIVAELGSNHNHDLDTAKRLIEVAVKAGVNAVKFQTLLPGDFIGRNILTAD